MEELWNLIIDNFIGCLLVFSRVTGIFTFNPIFGRSNVPMRVRVALSMALSVCMLAAMGGTTSYRPSSVVGFVVVIVMEALLGLLFGFFVNLILTVLIYAGELVDNQIGLGMAKAMDPSTGIQMPVFANFYYYLFILYFFITGGHLEYIRMFSISYDIIPIGFQFGISAQSLIYNIVLFMGTVMELALKLAMPIIAAELIVEFCVGVIMKAVPTIQVFVINIQLKILVGLFIMFSVAGPISDFLNRLLGTMWENLGVILNRIA